MSTEKCSGSTMTPRGFERWSEGHIMERPLRILIAKPGLDGHDRGAKIIAFFFIDSGM